ncbi:MAG TPA: hypothetical protein VK145_01250 [Candidatus Nanoarchaeia archaeon]|nr:hypothetical protein [Candidatus Nanoarchaeia archaeon]
MLLVAVAAVFTVAQGGLASSSVLRNRITAAYLAEEAMNGVKNMKDTNLLRILNGESVNWLNGMTSCANTPCGYDVFGANGEGDLGVCSSFDQCKVKMGTYTDLTGVYRQMNASQNNPSTVDTGFVRKIYIERTPGALQEKEAKVTVEVTRPGTDFQPFEVTSYIYNFWPAP